MKELLKLDSICQSYAQVKNDPVFWLTVYKCPTVSLRHWSALRVYRVDICPIWVTVPRAPQRPDSIIVPMHVTGGPLNLFVTCFLTQITRQCYGALITMLRSFRTANTVLLKGPVRWRGVTFGYLLYWLVLVGYTWRQSKWINMKI